jgi:hypothetical protein
MTSPIAIQVPCSGGVVRRMLLGAVLLLAAPHLSAAAPSPDGDVREFPAFVTMQKIDRDSRRVLEGDGDWNDDKERMLVRVLARLPAPASLAADWAAAAEPVAESGAATPIADVPVRVRGRAVFVAPQALSAAIAELAGTPDYDLVRIVDERGAVVDVATPRAPRAWPRWQAIDEPAAAVGMPLTGGAGPVPVGAAGAGTWPEARHDLLLAAAAVSWFPPTPLGRLGMDYALFDTVVDNRKIVAGDTEAFYALLTAAGAADAAAATKTAGGRTDILPLLDVRQKWFETHRGDPVLIEGIARKATRITVDEAFRRRQIGADHYWELEVFVDTAPFEDKGKVRDRFPVVCCVRELPTGMPSGDSIAEEVSVPAFAFKRYSYPLQDVFISSSQGDSRTAGERIYPPLVIGRRVAWRPAPSVKGATDILFWIFSAIIGVVAAFVAYNVWSAGRAASRDGAQRRGQLPDRVQLPGDEG